MTLKKILLTLLLLSFAPFFSVSASAGIKKNRTETAELKKKEEEKSPKKGASKKEKPSKSFSKKVLMTAISLIKGLTLIIGSCALGTALVFLLKYSFSSHKEDRNRYQSLAKLFTKWSTFFKDRREKLLRKS